MNCLLASGLTLHVLVPCYQAVHVIRGWHLASKRMPITDGMSRVAWEGGGLTRTLLKRGTDQCTDASYAALAISSWPCCSAPWARP